MLHVIMGSHLAQMWIEIIKKVLQETACYATIIKLFVVMKNEQENINFNIKR